MKRRILIGAVGLLGLGLLGGCGGQEKQGETASAKENDKTTIDFWSFWGSGERQEVIEEIIDDYNSSQNEVEVNYTYQPWGDIWTKSLSAITAGNPPDVIIQDINSVAQRAEAGQATNLAEYVDEDKAESFYPQLWETVEYEDDPYAIPFNTDTQVIFYNKDVFKEAGIKENQLPNTWDELEETAKKLDEKKDNEYQRIGFYPLWQIEPDVWAINGDEGTSWFDEDENVKIDTPNKVETLKWVTNWQKHYGKDTINQMEAEFGDGVSDPFISGKVGMIGQNINYYTKLRETAPADFDFGVIPLPEREEGAGHWSWGGGFVAEVPKGAEDPEASYDFIDYLTSTKVQEKFGEKSFDIMANQEANENLIQGDELTEKGKMIYKMADENFPKTVITPTPLAAPDYQNLVNEQIDEVLLGKKSPEEGMKQAQKSVENLKEK
ncbi:ABC transporter substrate-binding protein [Tetragenococcus halophilus]|uniref:ABC transporter substrate-binding protein n=1 Tax=Tetragenococcus halophilus TaxID=51669 RepID=UPI001F25937A|nr:ABC transporter substrate-binding protein [Tetragenococcus halophilus]MCF1684114.1 ABC transporter substrate-binding protein [Tetragenococcus halophilus]